MSYLVEAFKRNMKSVFLYIVCFLVFTVNNLSCYPTHKSNLEAKLDKDEKRYPNGTVVGQYYYNDKEGNPIHVKYYADDASYGVELKSVKVMTGPSDNPLTQVFKQTEIEKLLHNNELPINTLPDAYKPTNTKYKTSDPFQILKEESTSKKDYKTSPDYEIYFQNVLETPKKCGNNIRVYLDKGKRKIREASESYIEAAKYCNQL